MPQGVALHAVQSVVHDNRFALLDARMHRCSSRRTWSLAYASVSGAESMGVACDAPGDAEWMICGPITHLTGFHSLRRICDLASVRAQNGYVRSRCGNTATLAELKYEYAIRCI